jgi:hypothetical protein
MNVIMPSSSRHRSSSSVIVSLGAASAVAMLFGSMALTSPMLTKAFADDDAAAASVAPSQTLVANESDTDSYAYNAALPVVKAPEPKKEDDSAESSKEDGDDKSDDSDESKSSKAQYSLEQFLSSGVVNWGGYKFTYYSQKVLPGGGLNIPGRHVGNGGYVLDADGYIVLAGDAEKGTIFETPFGAQGKIYDRGTVGNHLDVYIR